MVITSHHNPRIKAIRRLFQRKHRDRTLLLFADGLPLLRAAVDAGMGMELVIESPDLLSEEARSWLHIPGPTAEVPRLQVSAEMLQSLSPKHWQHGVAAVLRQRWARLADIVLPPTGCALAVKEIRQPWSIGNIVRTCEAVGGSGVILIGDSADPYHRAAVRASLGAVFSQRLARATWEELATWKRQHSYFLVGTSPSAASDYREGVYRWPLVLLAGSERVGLSPEEQSLCDLMVRIPMMGTCGSHHVVVATALVLYEIYGQQWAMCQRGR